MTNWAKLRERFPVLRERSYFASQCLGPFLDETLADFDAYRRALFLRNRALEAWLERMFELIALTEQFIGAPAGAVALRDSATAGQAAIAAALRPSAERKRVVIASGLDFKSSRYLWSAQLARGFEIDDIEQSSRWLSADEVCAHIDERVAIVALPMVSPQSGALLPIAEIAAHARKMGALTVIDAYQAVGVVPVDVRALGVDVLVGGTHKWMCGASMGLAFLYVEPSLSARLDVVYPGWIGHADVKASTTRFEPAQGAQRFQQGPPPIEPVYTARAGLRFLLDVGMANLRARSQELTTILADAAAEHRLPLLTPSEPERRGGMICLDVPNPEQVVMTLAREGVDIDARPGSGIRIGPFPCLSEPECRAIVSRIADLAKH